MKLKIRRKKIPFREHHSFDYDKQLLRDIDKMTFK